jgi:hypothetical protein
MNIGMGEAQAWTLTGQRHGAFRRRLLVAVSVVSAILICWPRWMTETICLCRGWKRGNLEPEDDEVSLGCIATHRQGSRLRP